VIASYLFPCRRSSGSNILSIITCSSSSPPVPSPVILPSKTFESGNVKGDGRVMAAVHARHRAATRQLPREEIEHSLGTGQARKRTMYSDPAVAVGSPARGDRGLRPAGSARPSLSPFRPAGARFKPKQVFLFRSCGAAPSHTSTARSTAQVQLMRREAFFGLFRATFLLVA
jgi:hypothetical protein